MTMNDSQLNTITAVKEFVNKNNKIKFNHQNKAQAYLWVEEILVKFSYIKLPKADKGILRKYLALLTGYSRAQVTRLISQYLQTGYVQITKYQRHSFTPKYPDSDLKLWS